MRSGCCCSFSNCDFCAHSFMFMTIVKKKEKTLFFVFTFYNFIFPMEFLLWKIQVAQGKLAATELRYPAYGACWVF